MAEDQEELAELLAGPTPENTSNSLQWAEAVAVACYKHYEGWDNSPFETSPDAAVNLIDAFSGIIRHALPTLVRLVRDTQKVGS
jgi:hypothetical protein